MPHTPTILLGLKSDLRHKPLCVELLKAQGLTPVSTEQGQQVADRIGAGYMECSSKERRNVAEIFERAISEATKGDGRGEGRKGSVVGFRGERGDERGRRRRCRIL